MIVEVSEESGYFTYGQKKKGAQFQLYSFHPYEKNFTGVNI